MARRDHDPEAVTRFLTGPNAVRVLGAAFALAGVIMCGVAAYMWWSADRLLDRGQTAEATVVRLDLHDRDRASDRVVVRFTTADGREVTARVGDWDWENGAAAGQRQTVLYDPDDPEDDVADTRVGPHDSERFLFAGVGGLFLASGLFLALGRARRLPKWMTQGRPG